MDQGALRRAARLIALEFRFGELSHQRSSRHRGAHLLGLGSAARLNTPGTAHGNWSWKMPQEALTEDLAQRCVALNRLYARS